MKKAGLLLIFASLPAMAADISLSSSGASVSGNAISDGLFILLVVVRLFHPRPVVTICPG
jgi:hypothetical protein